MLFQVELDEETSRRLHYVVTTMGETVSSLLTLLVRRAYATVPREEGGAGERLPIPEADAYLSQILLGEMRGVSRENLVNLLHSVQAYQRESDVLRLHKMFRDLLAGSADGHASAYALRDVAELMAHWKVGTIGDPSPYYEEAAKRWEE